MQLHAFLLLFIITTDKTLASLQHHCGGNVILDQEPTGHINLTLPGLFNDTDKLYTVNQPSEKTRVCTWVIGIPRGRTVLLKILWLESGWNISVSCVWNEEDQDLDSGATALLSGCDRNKATLTWRGAGGTLNALQLAYHVQEDNGNSSEGLSTRHPDHDLSRWAQTGTSFTLTALGDREVAGATGEGRGRVYQGREWGSRSSTSSQYEGLLHLTSPQQGLSVTGRTDRETVSLPEEKPNNTAETSGAAHLTDSPMIVRERTHPYFQHGLDTVSQLNTENTTDMVPVTQVSLTDPADSSSITLHENNKDEYSSTQMSKYTRHKKTQMDQSVFSSSAPLLTSSPSELPSSWQIHTIQNQRGDAASETSGDMPSHSLRSQRSTDGFHSGLASTPTSDPLKLSTNPLQHESSKPAPSSSSQVFNQAQSSSTGITEINTAVGVSQSGLFKLPDVTIQMVSQSSDQFGNTFASSPQSKTNSPQSKDISTPSPYTEEGNEGAQTAAEVAQRNGYTISSPPDFTFTVDDGRTAGFTGSSFTTPTVALTTRHKGQNSAARGTTRESLTLGTTLIYDISSPHASTPVPLVPSTASTPSDSLQLHATFRDRSVASLTSAVTESTIHTTVFSRHKATHVPSRISPPHSHPLLPTSSNTSPTPDWSHNLITTAHASLPSLTTVKSHYEHKTGESEERGKSWQWSLGSTTTHAPATIPPNLPLPQTTPQPSQSQLNITSSAAPSGPTRISTASPKFYIVPDLPTTIKVESIELLLQIVVEESKSDFTAGLEEDTTVWLEPYLQKAPGFCRLLGVWSRGHAVQSLMKFKTIEALQWLSLTGPTSLLDQTGLTQAVQEGRTFRSSKIANITLGGLQGDVCDWLLQCPSGYKCLGQPGTANYSCSSVCHFDYCHHHGICTHHPGQLPVCRCLAGDDFWYMGQKCDVRMTRARLVGACLGILLIIVAVIGVLAYVAVRRYRAILIQAKVDQTRSSYRRFNHFDELSGRFWLRSWAGSADSLDNPAFTRSDELLHLRALDRPCCYHDDTLSLPSTCPSHGARINTIYPHSSQYGWRGSAMSVGDGVLDSGKASDLSVCSWPVEPIHWTPFPLLQQLAAHRTPAVRVSRPRSYCEGMELVDLGKSWTA